MEKKLSVVICSIIELYRSLISGFYEFLIYSNFEWRRKRYKDGWSHGRRLHRHFKSLINYCDMKIEIFKKN